MQLSRSEVERMLRMNGRTAAILDRSKPNDRTALLQTVQHMMVTFARTEVELTKIQSLGPPEEHQQNS